MTSALQRGIEDCSTTLPTCANRSIVEVSSNDVVMGRGSGANNRRGNRYFRQLVDQRKAEYSVATTKERKREIAREIIRQVHRRGGRFLLVKETPDGSGEGAHYEDVDELTAMKKCLHALREKKKAKAAPFVEPASDVCQSVTEGFAISLMNHCGREEQNLFRPDDVLFGSVSLTHDYIGNRRFRWLVEMRQDEYLQAQTKKEKKDIATQLLNEVLSKGGRFLCENPSKLALGCFAYDELGARRALQKCHQALREKKRSFSNHHDIPCVIEKPTSAHGDDVQLSNDTGGTPPYPLGQSYAPGVSPFVLSDKSQSGEPPADLGLATNWRNTDVLNQKDILTENEAAWFVLSSLQSVSKRPVIPPEEQERERQMLTEDEKLLVLSDLVGKKLTLSPNVHIRQKHDRAFLLMKREIDHIPVAQKSALLDAQSKCSPEEFSDSRLKAFLRFSDWDPKAAAERLAYYWECRRRVFGSNKYYLPMTIDGALRDDMVALDTGFATILPHRDGSGRQILWANTLRHTGIGYTNESLIRAVWYLHEVLMRHDTHGRGVIRIPQFRNATMLHVYPEYICPFLEFTRDCWPIKVNADHILNMSQEIRDWLEPFLLAASGKHVRLRSLNHNVPEDELISELAKYGILRDMLPTDVGGTVKVNHTEWIAARLKIEREEPYVYHFYEE